MGRWVLQIYLLSRQVSCGWEEAEKDPREARVSHRPHGQPILMFPGKTYPKLQLVN
jgi:hypothetical protein